MRGAWGILPATTPQWHPESPLAPCLGVISPQPALEAPRQVVHSSCSLAQEAKGMCRHLQGCSGCEEGWVAGQKVLCSFLYTVLSPATSTHCPPIASQQAPFRCLCLIHSLKCGQICSKIPFLLPSFRHDQATLHPSFGRSYLVVVF